MSFNESGTMGAALTVTQESLTSGNAFLNGFANAYKVDVTTADGSPDADDWSRLNMRFEGQDVQMFKKGTANAEKFTLAFWVKATKTGTNAAESAPSAKTFLRVLGRRHAIMKTSEIVLGAKRNLASRISRIMPKTRLNNVKNPNWNVFFNIDFLPKL
jgi:hypothetical protein